jgi:hypothetical protein
MQIHEIGHQVDGVVPRVLVRVPREEDERDVADAVAYAGVRAFESARWVAAEQNLGRSGAGAATLFEFLWGKQFFGSETWTQSYDFDLQRSK